jgi:galactokinase/mevalonate kinase-like predicted kinase
MSKASKVFFATAPGRAGIIGNPTDMYGGSVISCTTQERAAVLIEPSERLNFSVAGKTFTVSNEDDLELDGGYFDVAKAVCDFLQLTDARFSLTWGCNVPFGAGLSSSSAMIVAILSAVLAFLGRDQHLYYRAEMARHIELHYLVLCGYQDPYMCTFGGINYMDFREKQFYRSFGDEPYTTVESLVPFLSSYPFILANTGVRRSSATVHKPIRERWLEGDREVVRNYNRISHLARMGKRAMLAEDWSELGGLMVENHQIQRDMGGSGPENERLIDAALSGGALGAKLSGAGGGGTIIALTENPDSVIAAVKEAGATRILYPKPSPGVRVKSIVSKKDRNAAESEIQKRTSQEDFH